jgi:hypothetical protein
MPDMVTGTSTPGITRAVLLSWRSSYVGLQADHVGVGDLVPDAGAALDVELAAACVPGVAADYGASAIELLDDLVRETAVDELGRVGAVNDLCRELVISHRLN